MNGGRRCATCRFFGSPAGIDGAYDESADSDDGTTEHHYCARIIHGNSGEHYFSKLAVEPAVVTDGSGYAARLRVLPTFGCTLHEQAEPADEVKS